MTAQHLAVIMAFLDEIIESKRREIADKTAVTPLDSMMARAATGPEPRNFYGALLGGRRIISEVKKRSPRVRKFRQADDVDSLARIYEENGAAAMSVVTDAANFGTSLADAERLRNTVKLPLLVKDFVIDPYQIYEARAFGADAILLIARILDRDNLTSLLELAHSLGVEALVECHSRDEIGEAGAAGARIVGINNRDLDKLTVSLDTTRRLAQIVPDDVLVVSESGIHQRSEIEELSRCGVDAFLVGGALLESENPGALLKELSQGPDPAAQDVG